LKRASSEVVFVTGDLDVGFSSLKFQVFYRISAQFQQNQIIRFSLTNVTASSVVHSIFDCTGKYGNSTIDCITTLQLFLTDSPRFFTFFSTIYQIQSTRANRAADESSSENRF
jgi:hypothetical protein